jgi:tape measure domain-containing protein
VAADGGVSFKASLINDISGPSRKAKRDLDDLKKSALSTKSALEAPAPRRGGVSDWSKMTAAARRSQARDQVAQLARIGRLNAADATRQQREAAKVAKLQLANASKDAKKLADTQKKEAKRVADFKLGMAQQKLDKQGGLVDFASGGLGMGAAAIAAGALAAAAAVGYLAYQFGKASVEAAAFGERSRLALTLLTGSASVASAEFDNVRREAQQLGLDVHDTQAGFQKLLAAQFDIGKAKELLRMSADLQAIGASAEHTKRAIVAISQIKNTGYLQGDELNQLREAGVSTELVYEALGKRLGKTTQQIISMQEKRQLGSNDVIESILEAVRKKTGSKTTGDAGKAFASSTLTGMAGVFKARIQNAFVDIGDAILPGLQRLMKLGTSFVDKLANDPKIARFGSFLLNQFEYFVLWTEANWPTITKVFSTGLGLMTDSIRLAVTMFDTSTVQGKALAGVMTLLGLTLGVVAVAGFTLMLPLYLLIGAVGLAAYAVYAAIVWVDEAVQRLQRTLGRVGAAGVQGVAAAAVSALPGGALLSGVIQSAGTASNANAAITTAAESSASARLPAMLAGVGQESVTVEGEQQSPNGPSKTINMNGWQVGTGIDEAALMSKVRSTVKKELEES